MEDWTIQEQTGYEPQTTFYTDFSIADKFGIDAVKDTYKRAFEAWKNNVVYMTELVMALNWKGWRWWNTNRPLAEAYFDLYNTAAEYCVNHFKGDDLDYYYSTTD